MLSPAEGTLCWAGQCWGWGQLGWEGWEGQQQSVTSSVVPHPPALHPVSLISTWPGSSVLLRVGCFPAWLGHNFELRRRNFGQNSTFCVGLRKAFSSGGGCGSQDGCLWGSCAAPNTPVTHWALSSPAQMEESRGCWEAWQQQADKDR